MAAPKKIIAKHTRHYRASLGSGPVYWWQLSFKPGGKVYKKTAESFNLSQHVLNLRKSLVPKFTPTPLSREQRNDTRQINKPAIDPTNFLNPGPKYLWEPGAKLRYKYPWVAELSIFFMLELLVVMVYWPVRIVARFYYWLYRHLSTVWHEMLEDLVYYFELNYKIFSQALPWHWFRKRGGRVHFAVPGVRQLAVLVLIAIILVLPLKWVSLNQDLSHQKDKFFNYAQAALIQFSLASEALSRGEFQDAAAKFEEVSKIMSRANFELESIGKQLGTLLVELPGPQQQITAASLLVQAGKNISDIGSIISQALVSLANTPGTSVDQVDLSFKMLLLQRAIAETAPKIDEAIAQISKASTYNLPNGLQQEIIQLDSVLIGLQAGWQQIANLPNVLSQIIPDTSERRYLLVFQNYSELRPTGGFLGSLAIVETKAGKISNIEIPGGGPYDWQGQLAVKVSPPEPLRLVNSLWQLQDSNWFYDWPTSAQKIAWFIKQSGGPDFDGVIAINPDLVLSLLKILGPVDLPAYNKNLTSDNFIRETQEAVDLEYDRHTNRPKQFIADLAPILIDRIFNLKVPNQIEAMSLLQQSLRRKGVQIYFTDPNLEQQIVSAGWAGEVKKVDGDYLAIVRTNIGGGKTDLVIKDSVRHNVTLLPSGDLVDKVELTRTHLGDPFDIFYSRRNVSWIKFFVPQESTLIESQGFETIPSEYFRPVDLTATVDKDLLLNEQIIDSGSAVGMQVAVETNKTTFAGWLTLDPGQSKTVSLVYKLPFKLMRTSKLQDLRKYQLYLAKQSGAQNLDLTSTITLPTGWRIRWQEGTDKLYLTSDGIKHEGNWQEDASYGIIIEVPPIYLTNS